MACRTHRRPCCAVSNCRLRKPAAEEQKEQAPQLLTAPPPACCIERWMLASSSRLLSQTSCTRGSCGAASAALATACCTAHVHVPSYIHAVLDAAQDAAYCARHQPAVALQHHRPGSLRAQCSGCHVESPAPACLCGGGCSCSNLVGRGVGRLLQAATVAPGVGGGGACAPRRQQPGSGRRGWGRI